MSAEHANAMIRLMKHFVLWGFCLFAILCVGYAHAETLNFQSRFGLCELRVEKQGDAVAFRVIGSGRGVFNGFWPSEPGEVVLSSTTLTKSNRFLGIGEKQIEATLSIVFERLTTGLVPVSYQYSADRRLTRQSKTNVQKRCKLG